MGIKWTSQTSLYLLLRRAPYDDSRTSHVCLFPHPTVTTLLTQTRFLAFPLTSFGVEEEWGFYNGRHNCKHSRGVPGNREIFFASTVFSVSRWLSSCSLVNYVCILSL